MFLRIPTLQPSNKIEDDLRSQLHGYRLDENPRSNTSWRLRDIKDRNVVLEEMAFDTIAQIHCQHAHPGKNKSFDLL